MKLLALLPILLLFACDKNDTIITPDPPEEKIIPHIVSWEDTTFFDSLRVSTFTYNAQGNPISIHSQWDGTGSEPHTFTYDDQNRLIKHESFLVTTYLYNSTDTLPYGATQLWPYGQLYNIAYTYDEKARIVKVVIDYVDQPDVDTTDVIRHKETDITYDSKGNLTGDYYTSADYNDKPSIYRTNKWWQLIHVNFSENSLKVGEDYNEWGFPQKVNKTIFLNLGAGRIEYAK